MPSNFIAGIVLVHSFIYSSISSFIFPIQKKSISFVLFFIFNASVPITFYRIQVFFFFFSFNKYFASSTFLSPFEIPIDTTITIFFIFRHIQQSKIFSSQIYRTIKFLFFSFFFYFFYFLSNATIYLSNKHNTLISSLALFISSY